MAKPSLLLALGVGAIYYNGLACWEGTDPACISCDYVNRRCNLCVGMYVTPKVPSCQRRSYLIPNCISYATHNTCKICETGYAVAKDGLCRAATPSDTCAADGSDGSDGCVSCAETNCYPDADGQCRRYPCTVNNCGACKSNGACAYCKAGYTLYRGECAHSALNEFFTKCASATYVNQCDVCLPGFYINAGKCVA